MRHYEYNESEDSYEMALEWISRKDFEKAIARIRHAIELNPNFVYAYITLAETYVRMKNYPEAVAAIKKAQKIDPGFHRLDYLLARYAFKAGDLPLAARAIERVVEKSPEALYLKARERIRRAGRRP